MMLTAQSFWEIYDIQTIPNANCSIAKASWNARITRAVFARVDFWAIVTIKGDEVLQFTETPILLYIFLWDCGALESCLAHNG